MDFRIFGVFSYLFKAGALVRVSCLTAEFPVPQTGSVKCSCARWAAVAQCCVSAYGVRLCLLTYHLWFWLYFCCCDVCWTPFSSLFACLFGFFYIIPVDVLTSSTYGTSIFFHHQYLCNDTTAEIPLSLSAFECLNCQKVDLLREYSVNYNLVSNTHFFDVSLSTDLSDNDSSLIGLFRLCVISIKYWNGA